MKKFFVLIGIVCCVVCLSYKETHAQTQIVDGAFERQDTEIDNNQILDGAFERSDIENRKPMAFAPVREADVMWSKKIWRIIDLREKINQVLYFPTTTIDGHSNLINLFLTGIENEELIAYDARTDDEFKVPMTFEQVKEAFGATTKTKKIRNFDTGEFEDRLVVGEIRPEEVKQFMIKEEWFFNKQTSTLDTRILGICPIQEYYRDEDVNKENVQRRQVFWIYYPASRELLASHSVINPNNTAQNMSFDDLFIKRRFNSYVVQESNVYNNRGISQYLSGREAMMESKRIEQEIFNFEQDLWEY